MELDALKVTATPRSTGVGVTVNRAIGGCGPGGDGCKNTVWIVRFVKLSVAVTVDGRGRRDPNRSVRPDLDVQDGGRGHPDGRVQVDGVVVRRHQMEPMEGPRVAVAHEQVATERGEVRPSIDGRVRGADRGAPV